jgi:hypothetical protein
VATPECVTSCVADAVRRCARPVPLQAALARRAQVSAAWAELGAAIVHEQWGWPLPPEAEDAVREQLRGVPVVIVDRVDSADFFSASRTFGTCEILSLSKMLGTPAGGIARYTSGGAYLPFEPVNPSPHTPGEGRQQLVSHPAIRELFKKSQHVHPGVLEWLAANSVIKAVEDERKSRQLAARAVLDSPLSAGWPGWMAKALEAGAGPVWVPVLRGQSPEIHWRAMENLARVWGMGSAVRMFNWTGNPLTPLHEPSVAVPIHGGVENATTVVSDLGRLVA